MPYIEWTDINQASYGYTDKSFTLTAEEVKLLLALLANKAVYRGAWRNNGDRLTDADWDTVQAFVDGLMGTLTED